MSINSQFPRHRVPKPPSTFALPCSLARLIGKISKPSQSVDFSNWKVEGKIKGHGILIFVYACIAFTYVASPHFFGMPLAAGLFGRTQWNPAKLIRFHVSGCTTYTYEILGSDSFTLSSNFKSYFMGKHPHASIAIVIIKFIEVDDA